MFVLFLNAVVIVIVVVVVRAVPGAMAREMHTLRVDLLRDRTGQTHTHTHTRVNRTDVTYKSCSARFTNTRANCAALDRARANRRVVVCAFGWTRW